jgi:hypothetical protein
LQSVQAQRWAHWQGLQVQLSPQGHWAVALGSVIVILLFGLQVPVDRANHL